VKISLAAREFIANSLAVAGSFGVSQIIGVVGLITVAAKSAFFALERAWTERQLKDITNGKAQQKNDLEKKIQSLTKKLLKQKEMAKTSGLLLVPGAGFHLATRFGSPNRILENIFGITNPIFEFFLGPPLRRALYVGPIQVPTEESREELRRGLGAEAVTLETKDKRKVDALYVPGRNKSETRPTAVLFHPNGATLDGMNYFAEYFKEKGLSVVMVTIGGYHTSAPGTRPTELSTYHDAQAAIDFARTKGAKKILAFGFSLGGTLACQAGYNNSDVDVIVENTFTSMRDVTRNVLPPPVAGIGAGLINNGFKSGKTDGIYTTDGLNNKRKVKHMKGKFFAIGCKNDDLMGWVSTANGYAKLENFTKELARTYAKSKSDEENAKNYYVMMPGGHNDFFLEDLTAGKKVDKLLEEWGYL
jgi:hypothetical protein